MRLTIGKKLTISFLGLAALVFLSGSIGIFVLNQVSGSADTVVKNKVPVKFAVMKASIAVENAQKAIYDYVVSTAELTAKKNRIFAFLDEFDMWISCIQFGTQSEAFKNSSAGELYAEKGLTTVILSGSSEMQNILELIDSKSQELRAACTRVIQSHDAYLSYSVSVENRTYDLPIYILILKQYQLDWYRSLQDAAQIITPFNKETDPNRGPVGVWLNTYKVDNSDLMAKIRKIEKYHKKLMAAAQKINEKNDAKWKEKYLNRSKGPWARVEQLFNRLLTFLNPIYKNLEADKKDKQVELTASVQTINIELDNLVKQAEQEMSMAMSASEFTKKSGISFLVGLTLIAVIIASILGLFVSRYLSRNIISLARIFNQIAEGELREKVEIRSNDELGSLAQDTNRMSEKLGRIIGQIADYSSQLTKSSGGLTEMANTMGDSAGTMSDKSHSVTEAAEEMRNNMQFVATSCQEAAANVDTVSVSAGEINASLSKITSNSEDGRRVTEEAVQKALGASAKVNELGTAAAEISKVTEVISEISEQTNLLALNATIEAARAGEAGKGFAVVASEIKALAMQTAEATKDIRNRIQTIQDSTSETIEEIEIVLETIKNVNSIVKNIAVSVEEQSATTMNIAANMSQASNGLQEVNGNIFQSKEVTNNIANAISEVNQNSMEVLSNCGEVKKNSDELKELAVSLQEIVIQFNV